MRVAAPKDKRFRRAHVKPARRRRAWSGRGGRIARLSAVLAIVLFGIYQGAALVLSAEAFIVTRLTVNGNVRLSRGEVVALLDGLRGRNMVTVDLETWRRRLRSSPWVADAVMRRVLPGTIAVAIAERQPIGIGRLGADLYLVDARGSIIDQFGPNYAELDLPLIDGLAAAPRDGAALVDEPRATLAARLLADVQARPGLAKRVSQIDVSDVRDAVVLLKDDTAFVRLGDEQFAERLQSYLDLAPALRERVNGIDYVDMRFDERIYVRPHIRAQESGLAPQSSGLRPPTTQTRGGGQRGGNR